LRAVRAEVIAGPDKGRSQLSEGEVITVGTAEGNHLQLTDPTVSRYHLELRRQGDRVLVTDLGSTNGILYQQARLERASVAAGSTLAIGHTQLRVEDGRTVLLELRESDALCDLKGRSQAMRRLMARIQKVAETDVSVLIVGESGTGKELTARAIHELSHRASKPFITVDCGAISPTLVQSELFGHERGAFTGADQRHVGAFESADGGTLFLDEIGELPSAIQVTLLGALERKRFRRVGGTQEIPVDVRVVSATNRDVRAEVNAGSFRLDLFYRLAVTVLEMPPLRDRPEDVPLLVESFLTQAGWTQGVDALFPADAMAVLRTQRWEGNVRELRNYVEATVAMGERPSTPLSAATVRATPRGSLKAVTLEETYGQARERVLAEFERAYVAALLEQAKGNVSLASRTAQVDRTHLLRLIKKHGLK
jgi:DNA-binding NtrC family response regulator